MSEVESFFQAQLLPLAKAIEEVSALKTGRRGRSAYLLSPAAAPNMYSHQSHRRSAAPIITPGRRQML